MEDSVSEYSVMNKGFAGPPNERVSQKLSIEVRLSEITRDISSLIRDYAASKPIKTIRN